MAPDPVLHERIYSALKDALRSGRLLPGQHIDLQAISDEHRASVTPVREAVCRLVGEGLADFQRHGGFHIALLTADKLRELYTFNASIFSMVIKISSDEALDRAVGSISFPKERSSPTEFASATAVLFQTIAEASANGTLASSIDNMSDRLATARIAEPYVFRDVRAEMLMLNHGPQGHLKRTLSRRIGLYHRRRINAVDRIALAVQLAGDPPSPRE